MTKRRLGELLQAEGLVTEEQVRLALDEQRKSNLFLGEALVKLGFVSEEAIAHTIVQQFSLPFVSANQFTIAPDVLQIFCERMYYEYQFIALDKIGKVLLIAGAGLMNHDVLDELERLSGCKVCQFVSTWKDIRGALERYTKELRRDEKLSSLGSMLLESGVAAKPSADAIQAAGEKMGVAPEKPSTSAAPAPAPAPAAAAPAPSSVRPAPPPAIAPRPAAPPTSAPNVKPPAPAPTSQIPRNTNTPNVQPPGNGESKRLPPAKTGLLGLFKKQ